MIGRLVEGRPRFPVGAASHLFRASGENQTVILPLCIKDLL